MFYQLQSLHKLVDFLNILYLCKCLLLFIEVLILLDSFELCYRLIQNEEKYKNFLVFCNQQPFYTLQINLIITLLLSFSFIVFVNFFTFIGYFHLQSFSQMKKKDYYWLILNYYFNLHHCCSKIIPHQQNRNHQFSFLKIINQWPLMSNRSIPCQKLTHKIIFLLQILFLSYQKVTLNEQLIYSSAILTFIFIELPQTQTYLCLTLIYQCQI